MKSPKVPERVKKYPQLDFWGYFLTFSSNFGDFSADPKRTLFETFFGPERGGPGDSCNRVATLGELSPATVLLLSSSLLFLKKQMEL